MASLGRIDADSTTFTTAAAVTKNYRVKLDSNGKVLHADAAEDIIGTALRDAALGETVAVRLASAPSLEMVASGVIAVGAEVAGDNGGKVTAGTGTYTAITAAAADGDLIVVVSNR